MVKTVTEVLFWTKYDTELNMKLFQLLSVIDYTVF